MAEEPEDGPNPFEDGEAIRQFLELYTGNINDHNIITPISIF